MKQFFSFFLLCLAYQISQAQIGSAIVYLHTGTVSNISITLIHKTVLLDNKGIGIPYHIIDSLSTPDSSVANQIQRLFPKISIVSRRNGYFLDFVSLQVKPLPDSTKLSLSITKSVLVRLLNGETFEGEFISSDDSTATYKTNLGTLTIKKSMILSAQSISTLPASETSGSSSKTKTVLVSEYNSLPLLLLTIGGGAWAVSLFSDASDYSKAADAFNHLGLKSSADDANCNYNTKLWTGIGVSLVSVVFFVLAVTPTETYIEQPVTVIPTSNGIRVVVHF